MSARAFSFGEFRLLPEERLLLAAGRPVRISSRALDILAVLVDHPGKLLTKNQLIARAWPNTRVEENNLRVHIGVLRKLLGEGPAGVSYIATVPGRGYSFVGHVLEESVPSLLATVPPPISPRPLPAPVTRMIGRSETLERLLSRMGTERLVTIVGPGGIGKTTVALAMADHLRGSFAHGAGPPIPVSLAANARPKRAASGPTANTASMSIRTTTSGFPATQPTLARRSPGPPIRKAATALS